MGSSISQIYDRYDTYLWTCEKLNISPIGITDGFHEHAEEIIANMSDETKEKYQNTYWFQLFKP